jgi:hypothetical protein
LGKIHKVVPDRAIGKENSPQEKLHTEKKVLRIAA